MRETIFRGELKEAVGQVLGESESASRPVNAIESQNRKP